MFLNKDKNTVKCNMINMISYIKSKLYPHTFCRCGNRYVVTTDEIEGFAEYYCNRCGNFYTDECYKPTVKICYINRGTKRSKKPFDDIDDIMAEMGIVDIGLRSNKKMNAITDLIWKFLSVCKAMFKIKQGDVLVLQYPLRKYYEFICDVTHLKRAHVITLIHDLHSFRKKRLSVKREIKRLDHSDVIIVHNENMKAWLLEHGCKAKMEILGIFDYLSSDDVKCIDTAICASDKYDLMYVGDLSPKCNMFLYKIPELLRENHLFLYGFNFQDKYLCNKERTSFMGYVKDYDLMKASKGNFGLAWYGESLIKGEGMIGEYMPYNNPHKVSLYIRCNIPVIISKEAGLAKFVEENAIGICVDNLIDIYDTLSKISLDEYKKMKQNVCALSVKLSEGYFTRTAIQKALCQLNKNIL